MTVEVPRNAIVKREMKAGGTPDEKMAARHANSNDKALVQLDGDVMGTLPMRFEIAPGALRIIAPQHSMVGADLRVCHGSDL